VECRRAALRRSQEVGAMSAGDTVSVAGTSHTVRTGTVRWFNTEQGFGFLAPADGSDDVFVHVSEIAGDGHRTLTEGQHVRFSVCRTSTGYQARNVHGD
jgi:CspA family cold shock protein